jgi:FKBP-type peptidyl-prolyl cis-trans isomerase FkpA
MTRSARLALAAFALGAACLAGCPQPDAATKTPAPGSAEGAAPGAADDTQKTLYALGASIAQRSLPGVTLEEGDLAAVQRGFADAALGRKLESDPREASPAIQKLLTDRRAAAAAKEKEAGAAFLAEAAKAAGAETTSSGLVYQVVAEGQGAQPKDTDRVKVHYRGALRDGTVFDSSIDRGQPAVFALNRVVPCWTEGVQKMKVGGKAKLTCPSDLAYGDRGVPGRIPPGAPLVFDVELMEIVAAPPTPPAPAPGAAPKPAAAAAGAKAGAEAPKPAAPAAKPAAPAAKPEAPAKKD